jgi:hypothetical protein
MCGEMCERGEGEREVELMSSNATLRVFTIADSIRVLHVSNLVDIPSPLLSSPLSSVLTFVGVYES